MLCHALLYTTVTVLWIFRFVYLKACHQFTATEVCTAIISLRKLTFVMFVDRLAYKRLPHHRMDQRLPILERTSHLRIEQ